MSPSILESLFYEILEDKKNKKKPPIPERFLSLALEAYLSNKISIGKLSELLQVDVISLRDTLSKAKFLRNKKAQKI